MILIDVSVGQTGIYGLLGYAVVFFGLILLMLLVMLIGKIFVAANGRKAPVAPAPVASVPETPKETAPGSAGQLKLYDVDPKTAAMLMAITADKLQKPINELRFISIREVEQ